MCRELVEVLRSSRVRHEARDIRRGSRTLVLADETILSRVGRGTQNLLCKPFSRQELLARVHEQLASRSATLG